MRCIIGAAALVFGKWQLANDNAAYGFDDGDDDEGLMEGAEQRRRKRVVVVVWSSEHGKNTIVKRERALPSLGEKRERAIGPVHLVVSACPSCL